MYNRHDPEYAQNFLYLLEKIDKVVRRHMHWQLKNLEIPLTYDQWQVMKEVALNEEIVNQKLIAEALTKDDASVMRILDILVNHGLVSKNKREEDKRFTSLKLTDKGRSLYKASQLKVNKALERMFMGFTEGELKIVEAILKKMHKLLGHSVD